MNVAHVLKLAADRMAKGLELDAASAGIEAGVLLAFALRVGRAWLIAHAKDPVDPEMLPEFEAMVERRLAGEPAAYILGSREFYGLDFRVTQDVLVPRPETELLVDLALERVPEQGAFRVLDLGTGSGVVGISIARHRQRATVTAVDKSSSALAVAKQNGAGLENIRFAESDWFAALQGGKFDLILSNPPYIAEGDEHLANLKFEPALALTSGKDGLDAIRSIIETAPSHLESGGWLLFEHGYNQGEICRELLSKSFVEVATWRDLSGIERVSGGRLTSG
ncbi:MAG: peptide chain release factor N(5)-glutamine methyltransferase [Burkholderiales bacterium]